MTAVEWKEFWEKVEISAHELNCLVYRKQDGGGWRVIVLNEVVGSPSPEDMDNGVLVTQTRFGFRGDTGEAPYLPMIRIEWRAQTGESIPFGMSRSRVVYISQDPHAVFAVLYT